MSEDRACIIERFGTPQQGVNFILCAWQPKNDIAKNREQSGSEEQCSVPAPLMWRES